MYTHLLYMKEIKKILRTFLAIYKTKEVKNIGRLQLISIFLRLLIIIHIYQNETDKNKEKTFCFNFITPPPFSKTKFLKSHILLYIAACFDLT